jgi:hypothetical protein
MYNREGTAAKDSYNESLHVWRLADKRMIEFSAIQYEKDKFNQRGRPRDGYFFDEITEFTEGIYRFVTAWNRTTIEGQRCRIVVTGNPPTADEGTWVINYWGAWLDPEHPNPARFGELVWYWRIDDKDVEAGRGDTRPEPYKEPDESQPEGYRLVYPRSRTFIPARLEDNPILMQSGYAATLDALPEPLRSQMRLGLFGVQGEDDPWQLIPTEWINAGIARWKAMQQPLGRPDFIGVDVARGGKDKTVLCPRWKGQNYIGKIAKYAGSQTTTGEQIATLVMNMAGSETICNLDIIGVGSSPFDQMKYAIATNPVAFGGKSEYKDKSRKLSFANMRAEGYWRIREALDPELGINMAIPDDPELRSELKAHRWQLHNTVVRINKKDEVKEKIGRSPDSSDALAYAMFNSEFTVKLGDEYEIIDQMAGYGFR